MRNVRKQLIVFAILLLTNAILAFLSFALGFQEQMLAQQGMAESLPDVPAWLLGLANAGVILVLYGLLGLIGFWFARKLRLPGIFREGAGWRRWAVIPMVLGIAVGIVMVIFDLIFASSGDWSGFAHPPFPMSLIASATAGIGEEIIFRGFVMSLWAFLLNLILKRWGATTIALWIANIIAALAFVAGHLPAVMMMLNVTTPAEIPSLVLAEMFLLNGIVALAAGERYMRDGLVAAMGVHFWADIVWHVMYGLVR